MTLEQQKSEEMKQEKEDEIQLVLSERGLYGKRRKGR